MKNVVSRFLGNLKRFANDEYGGVITVQFAIVFPIFLTFFLMTYENGIISLRHVMLERGIDMTVRQMRLGILEDVNLNGQFDRLDVRTRICAFSQIIPDCDNRLRLEMDRRNLRAWSGFPAEIKCVNRGDPGAPIVGRFTGGTNNELMIIRACVRIDPELPTTGIGKAIVDNQTSAEANGTYALVSSAAYVVEPFQN